MPAYRIKLTRTVVETSTFETVIDLPSDDHTVIAAWAKIAAHEGTGYRHRSLHAIWKDKGAPRDTIDTEVTREPDFDEVAPAPPSAPAAVEKETV